MIPYLFVVLWYISLGIAPSSFIHVVGNCHISPILRLNIITSYIGHIFFTHSLVNRHLDCFYTLSIVSNAAVNAGIWVDPQDGYSTFCIIPKSEVIGSYSSSAIYVFILLGLSVLFLTMTVPIYIPISSMQKFPFYHILVTCVVICLSDNRYLNRHEVLYHCNFSCPQSFVMVSNFHIPIYYPHVFLGKYLFRFCDYF